MDKIKFEELNISENIKRAIKDMEYEYATPIQSLSMPVILEGKDIIGQSQTGTGKTLAFAIPAIQNVEPGLKNVQALILCPTRELAMQVAQEIRKLAKYTEGIKTLAIYGGENIQRQIVAIKKGVQIVIGTPGRVMDHIRRKTLKLENTKMVILDEADEMLNMGFEEDIETILKEVPLQRQSLLFSATMPDKILNITKKYLKNPKHIKIVKEELTASKIEQVCFEIKEKQKLEILTRIIDMYNPKSALVFCNTKRRVDDTIENLKLKGYLAEALHGDIKQEQRTRIMKRFKNGDFNILVATDVAARGIDVNGLEIVINYDLPQEEEYYVHRIGRTGRSDKDGKAFSFMTPKEISKLRSIEKYAKTKIKFKKVPSIKDVENANTEEMANRIKNVIDEREFEESKVIKSILKQGYKINDIANALYFMLNNHNYTKQQESNSFSQYSDKNGMVKLFINVGQKDNVQAKDLLGSIAFNSDIDGSSIGKIKILDKYSFIEIPVEDVEKVLENMKDKQIKGRNVNIEIAQI